jgi:hypothetical protein
MTTKEFEILSRISYACSSHMTIESTAPKTVYTAVSDRLLHADLDDIDPATHSSPVRCLGS